MKRSALAIVLMAILASCTPEKGSIEPAAIDTNPTVDSGTMAHAPAVETTMLEPVAVNANSGVDGGALFAAEAVDFAKPADGDGTVSPKALVAAAKYKGTTVMVAIDTKAAGDTWPNCVRLDFSGKGKFTDAPVVDVKITSDPSKDEPLRGSIGPAEVKFTRDGKTIPAMVYSEFTLVEAEPWLGLKIGMAMQGPCKFGDTTYTVRIIDGNGNFRAGDATKAVMRHGKLYVPPEDHGATTMVTNGTITSDTLLIDSTGRNFRGRYEEQLYGQPVKVDGVWYLVTVGPDGESVSAKALDLKTGIIKSPHPAWSMRIVSKDAAMVVVGREGQVEAPAGEWAIMGFQEYLRGDNGRGLLRTHNRDCLEGETTIIKVEPGKTIEFNVGSPVTVDFSEADKDGACVFTVQLSDVVGRPVDVLNVGREPLAPAVEIVDADGKVVATVPLTGGPPEYTGAWTIPAGAKGPFKANLQLPALPCEAKIPVSSITLVAAPAAME